MASCSASYMHYYRPKSLSTKCISSYSCCNVIHYRTSSNIYKNEKEVSNETNKEPINEISLPLLTELYLINKNQTKENSSKDFFHRLIENNEESIIKIMNRDFVIPKNSKFVLVNFKLN